MRHWPLLVVPLVAMLGTACPAEDESDTEDTDAPDGTNLDPMQSGYWCGNNVWGRTLPLNGVANGEWHVGQDCFEMVFHNEPDASGVLDVTYRQTLEGVGQCEVHAYDGQVTGGFCVYSYPGTDGVTVDEYWTPTGGELYPLIVGESPNHALYWVLRASFDIVEYKHASNGTVLGTTTRGGGSMSHDGLASEIAAPEDWVLLPECLIEGCQQLTVTGTTSPDTTVCQEHLAGVGVTQNVQYTFADGGRLVDDGIGVMNAYTTTETGCSRVSERDKWYYQFDQENGTGTIEKLYAGCLLTWTGTMAVCE